MNERRVEEFEHVDAYLGLGGVSELGAARYPQAVLVFIVSAIEDIFIMIVMKIEPISIAKTMMITAQQ